MEESEETLVTPQRMVTRGVARQQYAESPPSGSAATGANSTLTSDNLTSVNSASADDHDEIQSEYHMESSADSLFRTPAVGTRGRKRRSTMDDSSSFADFTLNGSPGPKRGRPRGSGRGRGGTAGRRIMSNQNAETADESSLFSMVKSGKNLNTVIDNWIGEYERNSENALVQLQQFFISCCGCKGIVSSVMLQTMEYSEIIRRMTEQFDEESGDYPLIMPGPQWKRFKQNFADFVTLLVNKCKASYVFDQRLMDSVIQLLTGLADSQVRAFRHTATFAAMKLSSALVDIALELVALKDKNNKQVETEKTKLKARGANDRLVLLINKKAEIDEKMEDVREMLQYIFKTVFVHRYRDVVPDIRSICINELGQWMQVYPQYFLEDCYLKYIGWSLYDKVSDVRLRCISSLLPLYDRSEVLNKLELFTNKFKDRLVSMVMDKDNEVAMRSCQLLTSIYRVFPSVLTLKDCVPIYELVYCNHRGLAQAAGEFLNTKVFQHTRKNRNASSVASRSHENAELIIDLIQFFIEGECHDHAAYLVDSLIDTNPMMKDWKTITDLLLSGEADRFDGELIEVLTCAVKQAATGEGPVGRYHAAKKGMATTKENRALADDRTRLSEVLIPQLPQLLHRFIADRDKVANLITIALHFQLDMYLAGRMEKHLDELMSVMESIVEKHADDEVLQSIANVVTYFTTNVAVAQHTETHRLKMLDGLALQLRHSVQRFHREQTLDDEDDASMLASFRKVTAFAIYEDLKKWQLWEPTISILTSSDGKQPSRDVTDKAVLLLFSTLNWDLYRLDTDQETNKSDAIKKLKRRRDQFLLAVSSILSEGASGVENAYLCLVDTLLMFNNMSDKSFEIELDSQLVHAINTFVVDNVFVEESEADCTMDQQSQIQLMHKRRNLLAQYCKLILHGILEISDSSLVLRYFTKFYTDFGDILKYLLNKCRELDRLGFAKAIVLALFNYYDDLKSRVPTNQFVDPNSDDFASLRELAKRFSSAFGSDQIKSREALAVVHREGILFALKKDGERRNERLPNLSFLEVLIEFSGRLMRQDKLSLLKYLEKHGTDVSSDEPYVLYKASLQERNDDAVSVRSVNVRGRGRGRGRGRSTPTTSVYGGDE
ncbi:hypothetical protein AB6A40_003585 [Gnathostoma spinigerum]|uniref:SCD domain-containing protein n=1 Tax=Gnathostoma spinigerum TaxID=75299 RepID=A0ABD6ECF8_9BILA